MIRRSASVRAATALCLASLAVMVGCAKQSPVVGVSGSDIGTLDASLLPPEILGLQVVSEDVSEALKEGRRSFADAVGLYSLRTEDLVMATVQVSRFLPGADLDSLQFRRSIVEQIGSSRSRQTRLGDDAVWLTTATKSKVAVWFQGNYLFHLTIREEFARPRTLLREVLEVKP